MCSIPLTGRSRRRLLARHGGRWLTSHVGRGQPRVARRLIAAGAAAISLRGCCSCCSVATFMGGLAPPSVGPGRERYAPSRVALADIPGNYLQWIRQAGDRYGLDWSVIAGIYSIETDFGRLDAPGVRSGENFAGAGGPASSSGDVEDLRRRRRRRRRQGPLQPGRRDPEHREPPPPQRRAGGLPARGLRLQPRQLVVDESSRARLATAARRRPTRAPSGRPRCRRLGS